MDLKYALKIRGLKRRLDSAKRRVVGGGERYVVKRGAREKVNDVRE